MDLELVFWSAVIVVVYAAIANRMLKLGEPLRNDALDLAGELTRDPRVSSARKREIENVMTRLTRRTLAWSFVCAMPVAFVMLLLRGVRAGLENGIPADLQRKWHRLQRVATLAALTNSPLALALFGAGMASLSFIVSGAALVDAAMMKVSEHVEPGSHHGKSGPAHV